MKYFLFHSSPNTELAPSLAPDKDKRGGGVEEEKGREKGRRARIVFYVFQKGGSEFINSILIGSPTNMKESRRSKSLLASFWNALLTSLALVPLSPSSFFFLPPPPRRVFVDQERGLEQVKSNTCF